MFSRMFDLSLLLQGDDMQWGKVHLYVAKIVCRVASGRDAEYQKDAVQGVMIKLVRGVPTVQDPRGLSRFIRTTTKNHLIDIDPPLTDPLKGYTPIDDCDDEGLSLEQVLPGTQDVFAIVAASKDFRLLNEIVASLSDDDKTVFEPTVRGLSGDPNLYTTKMIAQKLGISQRAYFQRWSRCRKAILGISVARN